MADLEDDEDESNNSTDDSSNTPAPSTPSSTPSNVPDPNTLFTQATNSLNQAQSSGVTQDQLSTLAKHQGSNAMLNLFMGMVGAAGRVDPSKTQDIINSTTQNEAQRIALQGQVSQQNLARSQAAGQLGSELQGAQSKQLQLQQAKAPASSLEKATYITLAKQAGNPLSSDDINDLDSMTHSQIQENLDSLKTAGQAITERQRNEAMLNMYNARGTIPVTLPGGQKGLKNKITGELTDLYGNNVGQPGQPNSQNPTNSNDTSKPVDANFINNQDQMTNHKKILDTAVKDYQNTVGKGDIAFNTSMSSLDETLNNAAKGNYVAASSLPAAEARLFEGLTGKITNYDIQLMNNPDAKGLVNSLQGKINGILGDGRVTPKDVTEIRQLMTGINQAHDRNVSNVVNQYTTRVSKGTGLNFNDPTYFTGRSLNTGNTTSNNQSTVNSTSNSTDIPYSDYLKQKTPSGIQ